jgi:hypothetical protein
MVLRKGNFKVGSRIVFSKEKMSPSPGKRAKEVSPHSKGEGYSYIVEKYWTLKSIDESAGTATLVTRRGKEHIVELDDPRLRLANFWERLVYRSRFPVLDDQTTSPNSD